MREFRHSSTELLRLLAVAENGVQLLAIDAEFVFLVEMPFVRMKMLSNMFDRVNVGRQTGDIDHQMEDHQGEELDT